MSSYYSQKTKTAFFVCLRVMQKASAFVVVSVLLFLPVGPAFAEAITPPANEAQPALEEATEEPASAPPTEEVKENESNEEMPAEETPVVAESEPEIIEAPPESTVPLAEPEENTDSELEEVLPALPTESDEGETAESGDENILPINIPEDTATTSEVSESESAPIASTTTTATTTTSSSNISLETTDSEQGENGSESPDVFVEDIVEDVASTTPEVEETQPPEKSETVEEEATSTEATPEEPLVETQINDSNRFQFGVDECVSVGNGSYYCAKADAVETVNAREGVYVALDADGDKEIFYAVDGEQVQITHNTNEDDAPFYDEVSDTIIWHRLVDGRYQIFTYDVKDEEERQLTTERYNNMQASRHGGVIVWQGWVGNDWEIMLEDDGEFSMLTDNAVHDIDPYINGDYIIWQSFEEESWKVKVYNRVTKELDTIADAEGGSVKNPRLVLVYDTNYENGDVETRGYDLKSGEVVPLSATPAPLPEELPDPDPVEEDRALVQVVTQVKPKTENETDLDPSVPVENDVEGGNDTASSTLDIVIPPLTQAQSTTTSPASDLLVQPLEENPEATSTPPHEHIPDVVVLPYEMTATTTPDSQE